MQKRTKTILAVAVIFVMAIASAAVWFVRQALERPKEAYAVQHTAELIIEYMRTRSNQWPAGWSELRTVKIGNQEYFKQFEKKTGGYSAFLDDLERRVAVDFTAQPTKIVGTASNSVPSLRVIWLRDGKNTHWVGADPNEMVADYLKSLK